MAQRQQTNLLKTWQFEHLGTTVTNKNLIHEEIKGPLCPERFVFSSAV
jgi:hypothetical protein